MHILMEAANHAQAKYDERRAMIELDWHSQKLAAGQITADQMPTEPDNAPVDKTSPAYKQAVEDRFKYRLDAIGYRLGYAIAERWGSWLDMSLRLLTQDLQTQQRQAANTEVQRSGCYAVCGRSSSWRH